VATELRINDGWYEDHVLPRVNEVVVRTAVAVRKDAQEICPVDTGALKESLTALNVSLGVARVVSHKEYCAAVELGFHGMEYVRPYMRQGHPVRGHMRQGNSPEQPFLRPSLYRTRDLSEIMG
jgi:hypothetical protein